MTNELTAIDLFSGAGGISVGVFAAGFRVLLANDLDVASARTYERNHPGIPFVQGDVRQLTIDKIKKLTGLRPNELDLLIGGPPCQGFSTIGKRNPLDLRNGLFREFLRIGGELRPKCMVIENVPGLASLCEGTFLQAIVDGYTELGYSVGVAKLLAAQYGVPQIRWRLILVGFRNDLGIEPNMGFPRPTHGRRGIGELSQYCSISADDCAGFITTREAIGDLPAIKSGEMSTVYSAIPSCDYQREMRQGLNTELYNHYAPRLAPETIKRIFVLEPGQYWRDLPFELLTDGMKRTDRRAGWQRYRRLTWDRVPRTLTTNFRSPNNGEYSHPEQDRTISIREGARIQSFPDRFAFEGSNSEVYNQIGNAVPPKLAQAIAADVRSCIEGKATHRLSIHFKRRHPIRQSSRQFIAL